MLCLEGIAAENQERKDAEIYRRRNWIFNNLGLSQQSVVRSWLSEFSRVCATNPDLRGGGGLGGIECRRSNLRV